MRNYKFELMPSQATQEEYEEAIDLFLEARKKGLRAPAIAEVTGLPIEWVREQVQRWNWLEAHWPKRRPKRYTIEVMDL